MALSKDQVGLIFKLSADATEAKAELEKLGTVVNINTTNIIGSFNKMGGAARGAGESIKKSNSIIRESVESVSSEIIESFGIDGDVANMLANQFVVLRNASLLAGAGLVGLVAGSVALTAVLSKNAAEVRANAQLIGLTTDQYQKYSSAASIANVETSALTDAIAKLRDRAKEARDGNAEIAAVFTALGVSAGDTARNAAPAFEQLLDILQTIPDVNTRIALTEQVLGNASDDTLKVILALTEANGELRRRVDELGISLDKQAVEDLSKLNREWNIFLEQASVFGKQVGLAAIKTFDALGEIGNTSGQSVSFFADAQSKANAATQTTTTAIEAQSEALRQLRRELDTKAITAQVEGFQRGIRDRVQLALDQISILSKGPKEAAVGFSRAMQQPGFREDVENLRRLQANRDALDDLLNPKKKRESGEAKKLKKALTPFDLSEEDLKAFEKSVKDRNRIELEALQAKEKAEQEHQQAMEAIAQAGDERLIALYEEAARNRVLTEEQVANNIAAIRIAAFAREEDRLKEERDATIEGTQERQAALDKLKVLEAQRAAAIEQAGIKIRAAQKQDIENEKSDNEKRKQYVEEQIRLYEELKDAREKALLNDPSSPISVFGQAGQDAADSGAGRFGQFGAAAREAFEQVSASAANMQEILTGAFSSIGAGLGSIIESFILTGQAGPQAFKKLAAGVIASVVAQAAVKAIFELAEGLAAAARFDYASAAQHFAAAKTYGIVAAVGAAAAVGIGALSGGGARSAVTGSGAASGPSSTTGRNIIENERRNNPTLTLKIETHPDVTIRRVEDNVNNNGSLRSLFRKDILQESPA